MSTVFTTKGLVDRSRLEVKDIVEEHDNARVTATEWLLDGELVRRDVHVNVLRGLDITPEQSQM